MMRGIVLCAVGLATCLPPAVAQATHDGVNIQASVVGLVSRRNAQLANQVGAASGTHPGANLTVWYRSVFGRSPANGSDDVDSALTTGNVKSVLGITDIGLDAQIGGGGFSMSESNEPSTSEAVGVVNSAHLELLVGRRRLHARTGLGVRSFTGRFGTQRWRFIKLGARATLPLGGSEEFEVSLGAAVYLGVTGAGGGSGREGETRLTFAPQCTGSMEQRPSSLSGRLCGRIFGLLGYRFEQFTARASGTNGGDRPEEIGSIVFGLGFKFP